MNPKAWGADDSAETGYRIQPGVNLSCIFKSFF